jgi:tetratricopeptide (TPR) repeat protein
MRRSLALLLTTALCSACLSSGPPTTHNDREWNLLLADYQWLETLRKAQPQPPASATRKQQIEVQLANLQKIEPVYVVFMDKLAEYYGRTSDPRASQLMAHEKIVVGDQYMTVLARYDRALDFYRSALQIDPQNSDARQRIALAEQRRYVSMNAFASVKTGMKEDEVRSLVGVPREDWIKQVVQNSRVYSVWIYPKSDGGASAVYFDNGVVYHTNWNAAAPAAQGRSAQAQ